jgi:hypothetical protein
MNYKQFKNKKNMLSLKWFKSAIERTIEKVVENKIEQAFNELDNEEGQVAPSHIPAGKPYLNIKIVNDTLTIVLNDGSIITKSSKSNDFLENIKLLSLKSK